MLELLVTLAVYGALVVLAIVALPFVLVGGAALVVFLLAGGTVATVGFWPTFVGGWLVALVLAYALRDPAPVRPAPSAAALERRRRFAGLQTRGL